MRQEGHASTVIEFEFIRKAEVSGTKYRGLDNYLYYVGAPFYNYSMMGPETPIPTIKAPTVTHARHGQTCSRRILPFPTLSKRTWPDVGCEVVALAFRVRISGFPKGPYAPSEKKRRAYSTPYVGTIRPKYRLYGYMDP